MSRKKSAIVLDLDECLLHAVSDHQRLYSEASRKTFGRVLPLGFCDPHTPKGTGVKVNMWLIKRPGLDRFLWEIRQHFDYIIVWSAGVYEYVHAICQKIFPYPLTYIFTRDDLKEDPQGYYKPLEVIWKRFPEIDPERTVHLDEDRKSTRLNSSH